MKEILGLNRYQVELRAYEKDWRKIFGKTKELLSTILKDYNLRIEHVGSTSIENLASKPILDIAIGLSKIGDIDAIRLILEKHNFIYRGDSRNDGGFLFVKEIKHEVRTHHIHIVDQKCDQWRNYIFFRDQLLSNDKLRLEYQELKRELHKQFKDNRGAYTAGKSKFIRRVLRKESMDDKKLEIGVIGGSEKRIIQIVEYNEDWPLKFDENAKVIKDVLGDIAVGIEHIGSTSVPGLAAKPIIDMLLIVKDSSDERTYLKEMESVGYQLRVREPDFHEHRMFRTVNKDIHIHVFSEGDSEIDRYLIFRNRLRENDADRNEYEAIKRELASGEWNDMNEYANAKTRIVERIIAAGFDDFGKNKLG